MEILIGLFLLITLIGLGMSGIFALCGVLAAVFHRRRR